jgi:protein transport protein SEC31
MTVVWDLKQKRPVFNFADKTRKLRCSSLAWNPENATQLAVASDDDGLPVVQIWDLRTAVAPLRQLEGHTAGILSLAWCPDDANLLLSCGRDNRTLCWNPDDGRIVSELPSADNWVHRVQWSSRSPAVFASASFDGQVSVYSMQGSEAVAEQVSPHGLGSGYAPKWLRRPAGAQFAFGGKLVSHTWDATAKKSSVRVQTVVTEPEFVQQADQLSKATDWAAFAQQKASSAAAHGDATTEQRVWSLLAALVGGNARQQIVSLLQNDADRGVSSPSAVNGTEESDSELFEKLTPPDTPSPASVQRAVVTGRFDQAVSQCISLGQWADALLFASCAGGDLWESTRSQYLASMQQTTYARITAAIVKGTFAELVEAVDDLAISWKDVLSTLTSFAPEADFCTLVERLAQRLEADGERDAAVMCYMCSGSMDKAITLWNGDKVEKALLLHQYGDVRGSGDAFYSLIIDYAQRLAAQGLLDLAARYMDLAPKNDAQAQLLRERILATIGQSASQVAPVTPPAPVSSQPAAVQQYQTAAPTTQSYVSHHPAPYQHQETAHQAQQFHLPHPDVQRVAPVASSTYGALNTGNAPIADGQNQQQPPHGRVATAYEQIAHSSTANTAQPVSATATVAAPANSGGSPTATPTSSAHSVEDFDVNTWITGANKDTAAYLKDLFKFVYGEGADMRKKDFVGKSLLSLFAALASNKLSAPVSSQLDSMAQSLSTRNFAAATEAVAKMTADHWSESSNFVKGLKQFIIDAKPKL